MGRSLSDNQVSDTFTFEEVQEPESFSFEELSPKEEKPTPIPTGMREVTLSSPIGVPITVRLPVDPFESLAPIPSAVVPPMTGDATVYSPIGVPITIPKQMAAEQGAALYNVAKSVPEFMLSPGGTILSPLGESGALGKAALQGLFAGLAAKGGAEALGEASVTGDYQKGLEGALMLGSAPVLAKPETRLPVREKPAIEPTAPPAVVPDESLAPKPPPLTPEDQIALQRELTAEPETKPSTPAAEQQTRILNRQVGELPAGTEVTLTGVKDDAPFNASVEVKLPNGKTANIPPEWLKSPTTAKRRTLPQLVKDLGRNEVERLVGEWDNTAHLSEDGKSIVGFADPRNQTGRGRLSTREFLDFLESDAAKEAKPPPVETGKAAEIPPPEAASVSEAKPAVTAAEPQAISKPTTEVPTPQVDVTGVTSPGTGEGMEGPGSPARREVPAPTGGEDVYGIAQRVREKMAAAGQELEVERGIGIAPPDSVERGRELLKADPNVAERMLSEFEKDPQKRISADMIAATRAKGEQLAFEARRAEEKYGTDSPEYQRAWEARSEWGQRTKAPQTEWHKAGQAQQGETDIDTGSYSGLRQAYVDQTGKDFTREQGFKAKRVANAVKSAIDAANKTVRNWAVEVAKMDAESRVNETTGKMAVDKVQDEAAKRALDAANKTVRDAAARLAEAENKQRMAQATLDKEAANVQAKAEKKALESASKTVRDAAARLAESERQKRIAQAKTEKKAAEIQAKAAQKALDAASKVARDAAAAAAKAERKLQADPMARVWKVAKEYIDKGEGGLDNIRTKIATDLGMTAEQVTRLMAQKPRMKYLMDEVWQKQQLVRQLDGQAKAWVRNQSVPGYLRALEQVPRAFFRAKVGFHGTVALGTHAPMLAFQPKYWKTYIENFGKMYKLVGSRAYYENQVQDLMRRKYYTTAQRAGLVNNPFTYEDYNTPITARYFGNLTGMGNRGYTILKILRQDMFDTMWEKLPKTSRTPEFAAEIAKILNHVTGVTKKSSPRGTSIALFAPRLEGSRIMWLAGDPIRAATIMANWKHALPSEKYFAQQVVKERLWVLGTVATALAINEGILNAMGSKQHINTTDPFKGDFLKFKVADMQVSYGNPMLTMARLPLRLWVGLKNEGKLNKVVHEDERVYNVIGQYARSQASPFAGFITDLAVGSDYAGRPLPRKGFGFIPGNKTIPLRLREEGIKKPYSWPEFFIQQGAPIPFQEAIREVWGKGLGMSDEDMRRYAKAMGVIAFQAGTGGRLSEDYNLRK